MATQFLASSGLSALRYFLPGDPSDLTLLFVPTAADLDAEPYYLDGNRKQLTKLGFEIREFDIKGLDYEQSKHILSLVDVLFVAGGNTFHLLNAMNNSGFGQAIKENDKLFYAGVSAGATVAGPDIEPIRAFDRPELADAPATTEGIGLVPFVVLPHYDYNSKENYDKAVEYYADKFEFVTLQDNQAVAVVDGKQEVVKSTQV